MWRAFYKVAGGKLVSVGTVFPDELPPGLAFKEYADKPDLGRDDWDEALLDFVLRPPEELFDRMDDLETHPTFLQFQEVFVTLTAQQQAKVRNAIRKLLGTEQFRTIRDSVEIGG